MTTRRKPLYAALAATGSALAAMTCCLPLGTLFLAGGAAGASRFVAKGRPYLMGLSVVLLLAGFWQFYRAPRCERSWFSGLLLWTSAGVLGAFLFFPQDVAGFLADYF